MYKAPEKKSVENHKLNKSEPVDTALLYMKCRVGHCTGCVTFEINNSMIYTIPII